MKIIFAKFFVLLILLLIPTFVFGQEKLWEDLTDKAITLYQQRKHAQAIKVAREALEVAKKTFGPEHPNVAESMDNLATYLTADGNYQEAEALYLQSLALIEKNFGPKSGYLAIFLNYLADFYVKIGKPEEAKKYQERAKAIRAGKI